MTVVIHGRIWQANLQLSVMASPQKLERQETPGQKESLQQPLQQPNWAGMTHLSEVGFPGDGWWYTPKFGVCDGQLPFLVWACLGAGKFSQLLNLSGGLTNWMTLRLHAQPDQKSNASGESVLHQEWPIETLLPFFEMSVLSKGTSNFFLESENLKHGRTVVSGSEQSLMSHNYVSITKQWLMAIMIGWRFEI